MVVPSRLDVNEVKSQVVTLCNYVRNLTVFDKWVEIFDISLIFSISW